MSQCKVSWDTLKLEDYFFVFLDNNRKLDHNRKLIGRKTSASSFVYCVEYSGFKSTCYGSYDIVYLLSYEDCIYYKLKDLLP